MKNGIRVEVRSSFWSDHELSSVIFRINIKTQFVVYNQLIVNDGLEFAIIAQLSENTH